ncbi:MAG TPA: PspA/IM30 family protein, partial [Solirubrobacteraceae bacterium]|nr:PspA/IM30 family protein [Solirubrobacteraceae bacterium]
LEAAGTFEDLTQIGSGEDDIDRQLRELSSTSEVDTELAKMKAELGAGGPQGALGAGSDDGSSSAGSGAGSQEQAS